MTKYTLFQDCLPIEHSTSESILWRRAAEMGIAVYGRSTTHIERLLPGYTIREVRNED